MSRKSSALLAICAEYLSSGSDPSDDEESAVNSGKYATTHASQSQVKVEDTGESTLLKNPLAELKNDIDSTNCRDPPVPVSVPIKMEPPWDFSDIKSETAEKPTFEKLPNPFAISNSTTYSSINTGNEPCTENFVGTAYESIRIKEEPASSGTEDSEASSDSELSDTRRRKSTVNKNIFGSEEEDSDASEGDFSGAHNAFTKNNPPRVKGEFQFSDLPPIEDLHITVPSDKCVALGLIKSVVDPLVVIEAFPNTPALNIDTVLFLDQGEKPLGQIFDVIGPVKQPFYCVRFNSLEHIEKNNVKIGTTVFCAPSTPHTNYVFLAQLRKLRGTDASWQDDIEPPSSEQEFSDDEREREAKKKKKKKPKSQETNNEDISEKSETEQSRNNTSNRGRKRTHEQRRFQSPNAFVPPRVPGFNPPRGYHHRRGSQIPRNSGYGPPRRPPLASYSPQPPHFYDESNMMCRPPPMPIRPMPSPYGIGQHFNPRYSSPRPHFPHMNQWRPSPPPPQSNRPVISPSKSCPKSGHNDQEPAPPGV